MSAPRKLVIRADGETLKSLAPLVREGVHMQVSDRASLRRTLVEDMGLDEDCVDTRIQAVFLDGSPVDDIDADRAREGCTLALAGALPGVAGICMQRGSRIGVFREGITHAAEHAASQSPKPLRITVKLFNVIAEECLGQVLAQGAELRAGRLAELLDARPEALADAAFVLDGAAIDRQSLATTLRGQDTPLILVAHNPEHA